MHHAARDAACQLGLHKDLMIPRDEVGRLLEPGPVLRDAHEAGLRVTGWTFRRENRFLPLELRSSADLDGVGDLTAELDAKLAEAAAEIERRNGLPWSRDAVLRTASSMIASWGLGRLWAQAGRVRAPSLVVWGDRDRLVSPRLAARTAAAQASTARSAPTAGAAWSVLMIREDVVIGPPPSGSGGTATARRHGRGTPTAWARPCRRACRTP